MPERRIPMRMPEGWEPPVPAHSAVVVGRTTIAYYGVQSPGGPNAPVVDDFRTWIVAATANEEGPDRTEWAEFTDATGSFTWIAIGYWVDDRDRFDRWSRSDEHEDYWADDRRLTDAGGVFREVLHAPSDRIESLLSQPDIHAGLAGTVHARRGPIAEHNYWGGMRDRLPASAIDPLDPAPVRESADRATAGRRVVVPGLRNLAVIRSGQLTGDMEGDEREFYERKVNPALEGGMRYLRDHPESGCISCRYMTETDAEGTATSRTFGLAAFGSLRQLEDWAEHHPSHLKIFNEFLEMAERLGGDIRLRLWHEVAVLAPEDQYFEYVNCHSATGMLAAGRTP
jgi:aldoxime dehydratase